MGQKIHPKGFRLGMVFQHYSRWFAKGYRYKQLLLEDVELRKALQKKLKSAGLSHVEIERSINKMKIILHVAKPGIVIGRGGSGLEEMKKFIEVFLSEHQQKHGIKDSGKRRIELAVEPVKEPQLNAFLVASTIADQLARRMPHKRVCSQAIDRVMNAGAKGVKIRLSGRIAGAEIARRETYKQGSIPLSTIREDVDFAHVPSLTKSGYIGVKVWICR
ncbi:MAG: 30S ribosomal protein S3 [Patescibacteria group bacterium]|nr:30S ribosomal protein S3 [Patescibacteria group bacterium]